MWKSFENIGLQTSEKVSWEKKETCAKHKIDRSQNGRSNNSTNNNRPTESVSNSTMIRQKVSNPHFVKLLLDTKA